MYSHRRRTTTGKGNFEMTESLWCNCAAIFLIAWRQNGGICWPKYYIFELDSESVTGALTTNRFAACFCFIQQGLLNYRTFKKKKRSATRLTVVRVISDWILTGFLRSVVRGLKRLWRSEASYGDDHVIFGVVERGIETSLLRYLWFRNVSNGAHVVYSHGSSPRRTQDAISGAPVRRLLGRGRWQQPHEEVENRQFQASLVTLLASWLAGCPGAGCWCCGKKAQLVPWRQRQLFFRASSCRLCRYLSEALLN